MKKFLKISTFCIATILMSSCGSSKKVASDTYYSNPNRNREQMLSQPIEKKRAVREVDKLVAAETTNLRAVGLGNDVDEKYARSEALRDAKSTLAGYIETAIISLTKEYHKKATVQTKKYSESNLDEYVETSVAQKISSRIIGVPEIFELSDGTIRVCVCVELSKPTTDVLGDMYNQLTKDEIIGTDYDKAKFIQDNKDRIKELQEKVK